MRDVSCVTCRACDVARDRSIGRESGEESVSGGRGDLAKIPPSLLLCHFRLFSKMLHEEIRQLRFPKSEVGGVIPKHEVPLTGNAN